MTENRREIVIRVPGGVHARLAVRIAQIARFAQTQIRLESMRGNADISSPVALLQLGLTIGDSVVLSAPTTSARPVIEEIATLLEVQDDAQRRWIGRSLVDGFGVGRPWWPSEYASGEIPQIADDALETDPNWSLARSRVDEKLAQEEQSLRDVGAFDLAEIITVERQLLADERLTADLGLYPSSLTSPGAEALIDLGQRLSAVLGGTDFDAAPFKQDIILLGYRVMLTHLLGPASKRIRGIITCEGGTTSHTAIAAHWLGIPMLAGFSPAELEEMTECDTLSVDGHSAAVSNHLENAPLITQRLKNTGKALIETISNLGLWANADTEETVRTACEQGAVGIGLVRNEVLFLGTSAPSEEDQFRVYSSILAITEQRPVTIRVADLGSTEQHLQTSINQRGMSVLLQNGDALRIQFRALLRASVSHNLNALLPLVRTVSEWRRAKDCLLSEQQILEKTEGKELHLPVGISLEAPALIWSLGKLLDEVAFVSIGSNDLSALLFAQVRDAESSLDARVGLQPALWRCLASIAEAAQARAVPAIVCGMLAGLWPEALLLRGLGFQLSLATDRIQLIARDLETCTVSQASDMAAKVQQCNTAAELVSCVKSAGFKIRSEV